MGNCSCGCSSSTIPGGVTSNATIRGRIYAPTYVSAYSIAVQNGFTGTEQEWLESLKGEPGFDGKSAYELAVESGFEGSVEDWLASLKGKDGKSAYQIAVDHGYTGSEDEWISEVSGNQEIVTQLQTKINEVTQTLDRYGSKLEPVFEAESQASEGATTPVTYKLVITEKEPDDKTNVAVSAKLSAKEITDICV